MSGDTKTQILDLAEELTRCKGFNGFSYRDIARPLGIANAAVHYHFPTKADLGVAVVRRYLDLLHSKTGRFMRRGGDALPQLEGLFYYYVRDVGATDSICPIGTVAADYPNVPEAMRREGKEFVEGMIRWMTQVLVVGREQGTFAFQGAAGDKAVAILATLQGASQMARLTGIQTLHAAIVQIRSDLGLESGAPAGN